MVQRLLKKLAAVGHMGKDSYFQISDIRCLPREFHGLLETSTKVSCIPKVLGKYWNFEKAIRCLSEHFIKPVRYSYGGRAANVAYQVARLGGSVNILSEVGDDLDVVYPGFFGGGYRRHLENGGVKMKILSVNVPNELLDDHSRLRRFLVDNYSPEIDMAGVLQVANRDISTVICVHDQKGRSFFFYDDLRAAGKIAEARPVPLKLLESVDSVFITSGAKEFNSEAAREAYRLDKPIILDVGFYDLNPNYIKAVVPYVEILFGNRIEIDEICRVFRCKSPTKLFKAAKDSPQYILVHDKWNEDVLIFERDGKTRRIGPVNVNRTGTSIGCCDGFAAGFLSFYQRGRDIEECCQAGLIISSFIWEAIGVQEGMVDELEFIGRYQKEFYSTNKKAGMFK